MTASNYNLALTSESREYSIDPELAAESTARFRARMEGGSLPYKSYRKGYFIPVETIRQLLSQNEGQTTGMKVYFGEIANGKDLLLELIFVATHNVNGQIATDFNVPAEKSLLSTKKPDVAIARPCPHECGDDNAFNTDELEINP